MTPVEQFAAAIVAALAAGITIERVVTAMKESTR